MLAHDDVGVLIPGDDARELLRELGHHIEHREDLHAQRVVDLPVAVAAGTEEEDGAAVAPEDAALVHADRELAEPVGGEHGAELGRHLEDQRVRRPGTRVEAEAPEKVTTRSEGTEREATTSDHDTFVEIDRNDLHHDASSLRRRKGGLVRGKNRPSGGGHPGRERLEQSRPCGVQRVARTLGPTSGRCGGLRGRRVTQGCDEALESRDEHDSSCEGDGPPPSGYFEMSDQQSDALPLSYFPTREKVGFEPMVRDERIELSGSCV